MITKSVNSLVIPCLCFLLNARFLIYRHKYTKTKPTVSTFIDTIKWVKISGYKIAKQSGNRARYFDKWNCI